MRATQTPPKKKRSEQLLSLTRQLPSKITKPLYTNPCVNTNIDKLCKQQRRAFNKYLKTPGK